MLLNQPALDEGAEKKVMGDSERLAEGSVSDTRSSERNWRRLALSEKVPQSNRRLIPPCESIDCVTSRGSKEFWRTKSVEEA